MVKVINIIEQDGCDICLRDGNAHGYANGLTLCSGDCSTIYEKGLVDLKFINSCIEKIKTKISGINKEFKPHHKEYTQLHIDMLKTLYRELSLRGGKTAEYYLKRIEEELDSYWKDMYDTELQSTKEKKLLEVGRIKQELSQIKKRGIELNIKLKQILSGDKKYAN